MRDDYPVEDILSLAENAPTESVAIMSISTPVMNRCQRTAQFPNVSSSMVGEKYLNFGYSDYKLGRHVVVEWVHYFKDNLVCLES